MAYHDENEPARIVVEVCDVPDAEYAKNIRRCLQEGREGDDPGVCLAIDDALSNVCDSDETEEDGEGVCCTEVGAKVWPNAVRVGDCFALRCHGVHVVS
jgi:hypothetical protein